MATADLVCPKCQCQLSPPSAGATGMSCPRCLTWLEFDPTCMGTCLSCHKMRQASPSPCIESSSEGDVIPLGYPVGSSGTSKTTKGWQNLFSWIPTGR